MTREEEFQRFLNFSVKQKYNPEERIVGWDSWLAAKHDAKPVVELHVTNWTKGSIYSVLYGEDCLFQCPEKQDALDWVATSNYRLE